MIGSWTDVDMIIHNIPGVEYGDSLFNSEEWRHCKTYVYNCLDLMKYFKITFDQIVLLLSNYQKCNQWI